MASSTVSPAMNRRANACGPAHPVAGRERLQCSAVGERLEEGLGRDIEHQCVRPEPDVSRCSMRAGVVAEHVAVAHAEPAAIVDDDAARFERLGGFFDGLPAARDAEVRADGAQRLDDRFGARFEIAPA